jgi:4'-phosphopantetheinyl transferase
MWRSRVKKDLKRNPLQYMMKTIFGIKTMAISFPQKPSMMPPVRKWSGDAQTRCSGDDVASYWREHDAVTFLVDLGIFHPSFRDLLTEDEKNQELRFKPAISRQRFVVSRTMLKYILARILSKEDITDISLIRNDRGRILVKDHPSVYISLSYSGNSIAISAGKSKIGSDIEGVRSIRDKKIISCPLFKNYCHPYEKEHTQQVIHLWTLVESYAKFCDKNPYPFLNTPSLFTGTHFVSYYLNHQSIFSLTAGHEPISDALVWLDMSGRERASLSEC